MLRYLIELRDNAKAEHAKWLEEYDE